MERCQRYGFTYDEQRKTRRRIFFGSLIADESWHTILGHAIEAYGLYHTVALIESNATINTDDSFARQRHYEPNSTALRALQSGVFGPATNVTVDLYIDHPEEREGFWIYNGFEFQQRERILHIWKENGMAKDDIGIVSDLDEFFSRDFLLAAQSCDVPEFRPGQDCKRPKLIGLTVIFEGSPSCHWHERAWFHPDMMLGECVDTIGDSNIHKPGVREWDGKGPRTDNYGYDDDNYDYLKMPNTTMYPLWKPEDFRMIQGGRQIGDETGWSAFHLHNYFNSIEVLRRKYLTYSHPIEDAEISSLNNIHGDVTTMLNCLQKLEEDHSMTTIASDRPIPIIFQHSDYVEARNEELIGMVKLDAARSYPTIMGLAVGYDLDVFKFFVGSLRATGFAGNIILGVKPDLEEDVWDYLKEQKVIKKPVEMTNNCTYTGFKQEDDEKYEQDCLESYPDYKISWGRFALYRDWLKDCATCTGEIMLTDVRDAFFQRDPFHDREKLQSLMFFEEHPNSTTNNWLTFDPVLACRNYTFHGEPMLCSGSIMGSREGILDYIDVMLGEFDYWKDKDECRFETIGDDQSIHNYLYYTNQFNNATVIPHRTGPIHVIGYEGSVILAKAEANGGIGNDTENWKEWLPSEYNLIDPTTGLILNKDGSPSPQIHQFDRIEPLLEEWLEEMEERQWPFNKVAG